MTYKAVVLDYAPKTKKMAIAVEEKANEKAAKGWELVTFSVTNSGKAILVFSVPEDAAQDDSSIEDELPEKTIPDWVEETVGEAE